MKTRFFPTLFLTACIASSGAFASVLVKEKAKQIANPNYVPKSPVVPPQPGGAPAAPGTTAAPEPSFSKLLSDVAIIKTKTEVPADLRQQLQKDMAAVVPSLPKASEQSLAKLAEDVSMSIAGKKMSTHEQADIARDLGMALYRAKAAPNELPALLKGLKDALEIVDVKPESAQKVVADMKIVVSELQGGGSGNAAAK